MARIHKGESGVVVVETVEIFGGALHDGVVLIDELTADLQATVYRLRLRKDTLWDLARYRGRQ